ncbi:MAG: hypothetical protein KDE34_03950 [Anaerolineales bacterium]|nr:hypothetical protein [Anaerolineales bacterium]MCB8962638.1 hypothetical protein [Ardenticatenales bacterium]
MSELSLQRVWLGFSLQNAGCPTFSLDEQACLSINFQDAHERALCLLAEETAAVRWQRLPSLLSSQEKPGEAYLIADSPWLAEHQREGRLATGRIYQHLKLNFADHGVLEFLAVALSWHEAGSTALEPIALAVDSAGPPAAEVQISFQAHREGAKGFYRFALEDLPATVQPWPAGLPLPETIPAGFTNLSAPDRPGLYAAVWPDGQLRCLAQVGQGQPRKWLSLWHNRAQAAVAWADSQAVVVYRPDKTLETISPNEPAGETFPIPLSFFDWTSEVILEILS